MKTHKITSAFGMSLVAGITALLVAIPFPVLATHRPGHGSATGGSPAVTENTDSDGLPNNIADEGDNRHPSGKDRSVEQGGSGDQGSSSSTPDQDGRGPDRDNGGTDKPDGPGGADIFDQDRNNGCGNDDDFDDDNEGWCGRQTERGKPDRGPEAGGRPEDREKPGDQGGPPGLVGVTPGSGAAPAGQAQLPGGQVAPGAVVQLPGAPSGGAGAAPPTAPAGEEDEVLGQVSPGPAATVVPRVEERVGAVGGLAVTGFSLLTVLLVVAVLLLAGAILANAGRARRSSSIR
jgi:hypothetical protein